MSDKLKVDFDLYYKELENFTGHFKTSSQQIETDKTLSRVGKHAKSEELKTKHESNINDLAERFQIEFDKRVVGINDFVNGKKKDPVLDAIKKKFSKNESLSSDESNRLLLHEMQENKLLMRKSNFQNMLVNADEKQLRKTAQTLNDSKDVEKLTWLQESVSIKGDTALANTIQGQADGIRTSQLTDEQRNLQEISKRTEKGVKLFNYSLERSKTGIFIDARQDEVQ